LQKEREYFFNILLLSRLQLSTSFAALTMASVATAFGMLSPLNAMQIYIIISLWMVEFIACVLMLVRAVGLLFSVR
jgi:hypothetical protein